MAVIRSESTVEEMPLPAPPPTPVPPIYREFSVTTGGEELEHCSGVGLTLDDVLAHCHERARGLWLTLEEENQAEHLGYTIVEGYLGDMHDEVIWEGGRVRAVLRLTVEARPDREVTRFDPPAAAPPARVVAPPDGAKPAAGKGGPR